MHAIEEYHYSLTAGDLSAKTGISVARAHRDLLDLANLSGATLKASKEGDVVYLFPPNFKMLLRQRFFTMKLLELFSKIWDWTCFLIRISFGILLLLSILVLMLALLFLLYLKSHRTTGPGHVNPRNQRHPNSTNHILYHPSINYHLYGFFHPFHADDLIWLIFWNSRYRSSSRRYFNQQQHRQQQQQQTNNNNNNNHSGPEDDSGNENQRDIYDQFNSSDTPNNNKMNFFEVIFSFLFGDGDPNNNLEQRRVRAIASLIRHNNGVVIAEQVRPYLDEELLRTNSNGSSVHEGYMIPILHHFEGFAKSNDGGELIYLFPNLKTTNIVIESERQLQLQRELYQDNTVEEERGICL